MDTCILFYELHIAVTTYGSDRVRLFGQNAKDPLVKGEISLYEVSMQICEYFHLPSHMLQTDA